MRSGMNDSGPGDRDEQTRVIGEKLRMLPRDGQAPYEWAEFRRQWEARRGSLSRDAESREWQRARSAGWRRVALAAGFAAVIAAAALWIRFDSMSSGELSASRPTDIAGPPLGGEADPAAPFGMDNADPSSRWLASQPPERAIVRVDTRFAVADLEDRIAWVDDLLNAAQFEAAVTLPGGAHVVALKRERAQLVNSLAQVRYAETLAAGLP